MSKALKASDVYVSETDDIFPEGTPTICIHNTVYDLREISTALLLDEKQRGFPQSVCLQALKLLAAAAEKRVKAVEKADKRKALELAKSEKRESKIAALRLTEEKRLKDQADRIDPLMTDIAPYLEDFGGMVREIVKEGDVWVSFTKSTISFTAPLGIDMSGHAEVLGQKGIGLKAAFDGDDVFWVPSVKKASGSRVNGVPILVDGNHRLKPGKANLSFNGEFSVANGRIYIGYVYMSGVDFLAKMTTETGNPASARPWGHPAKTIAAISVFVEDASEKASDGIDWPSGADMADTAAMGENAPPEEGE